LSRAFVFDTSSIIAVKERYSRKDSDRLYRELRTCAEAGEIVFPRAVLRELKAGHDPDRPNKPLDWAERVARTACYRKPLERVMAEMFAAFPAVGRVLDVEKDEGADEAAPYVLAHALMIAKDGTRVTVVTEEKRNRRDKMAMKDACGILDIPAMSVDTYLRMKGFVSWARAPSSGFVHGRSVCVSFLVGTRTTSREQEAGRCVLTPCRRVRVPEVVRR